MNRARLIQLEKFVEEDPTDPFNKYALALELANEDQSRALALLTDIIKISPSYVPSYYQAANLFLEQNRLEEARIVIEKGIVAAHQAKEPKTIAELKSLLEELD